MQAADRRQLLLVEPNDLTRWALSAYLERWFHLISVESAERAEPILARGRVDAIVISDDVPTPALHDLERHAREANQDVRIVHTISRSDAVPDGPDTITLEKPFELDRLARLLGVDPDAD